MRRVAVASVLVFVVGACTSGGGSSDADPEEDKARPPRAPEHVATKRVSDNLTLKKIKRCLYDERVEIDAIAGQYYGPTDLVRGEVEVVRSIDFTLPDDIKMLSEKEFGDELETGARQLGPKPTKVNRWIEANLGYRPFSTLAEPSGKGTDLVAGFYDPKTKEVVVQKEGELDGEYIVLAHELAHAAVDQRFGLKKKSSPLVINDKQLAYQALIEGDATLTEFRIGSRLGKRKAVIKGLDELITSDARFKEDRAAGVPHAATDRFVFPYRWGAAFACSVLRKKGWGGVNKAHARPPVSTAEIMFPERFLNREKPKKPERLNSPPKRWKVFGKGTIGTAHLKALFEAPGDKKGRALSNPLGRAASWAGGSYTLWAPNIDSTDSILGMSFVEHDRHKGVLCSSLMKWYRASFKFAKRGVLADDVVAFEDGARAGVIDCRDGNVKVAVAPTLVLAQVVIGL